MRSKKWKTLLFPVMLLVVCSTTGCFSAKKLYAGERLPREKIANIGSTTPPRLLYILEVDGKPVPKNLQREWWPYGYDLLPGRHDLVVRVDATQSRDKIDFGPAKVSFTGKAGRRYWLHSDVTGAKLEKRKGLGRLFSSEKATYYWEPRITDIKTGETVSD